jgi:Na+-translocating ferredoxin:NAD+ oxidoreductase RnfG subunit
MSINLEQINNSNDFEINRSVEDNSLVKKLDSSVIISNNNQQLNDNMNNLHSGDTNILNFMLNSVSSINSNQIINDLEEKIKSLTTETDDLKKKLESSKEKIKECETVIEKQNEEIKSLKKNIPHLNSDSELLNLSLEKKYSSNDLNKILLKSEKFEINNFHSLNYSESPFLKAKTQQIKSSAKLKFINKKIKNSLTSKNSINSKENKDEIKKEEDKLREEAKQLCYKSIKDFRKSNNIPENITNEEVKFALKANHFDYEKALTFLLKK